MTKYIAFAVILVVVTEVAICRHWHDHYDNDFRGHNPWYHRFDHHSHHNHGWDRSKGTLYPRMDWNRRWHSHTPPPPFHHHSIKACMSCPVPLEYNPVCGTNNVTYKNIKHLNCARRCGVVVELLKSGQCFDGHNDVIPKPVTTSTTFTPINGWELGSVGTTSSIDRATGITDLSACVRACVKSTIYSPVCGTDGITYNNEEHLYCAQICGIEVTISKYVACPGGNNGGKKKPEWTTKLPIPNPTITLPPDVTDCIRSCPMTPEYNPVCGSNGVTYNNYGHLRCAQLCGVYVTLRRKSPCQALPNNGDDIAATTQPPLGEATTMSPAVRDCIRFCPVTTEYNPVCGTNNVTYSNPGRLECAKNCGVVVNVGRFSSCIVPISTNTLKPTSVSDSTTSEQVTQSTISESPTTEAEFDIDPRMHE